MAKNNDLVNFLKMKKKKKKKIRQLLVSPTIWEYRYTKEITVSCANLYTEFLIIFTLTASLTMAQSNKILKLESHLPKTIVLFSSMIAF